MEIGIKSNHTCQRKTGKHTRHNNNKIIQTLASYYSQLYSTTEPSADKIMNIWIRYGVPGKIRDEHTEYLDKPSINEEILKND